MSEWQENTRANPFWKDSEASSLGTVKMVEVMLKDGTIHRLSCPTCAKGSFGLIVKWRKLEEGKTP